MKREALFFSSSEEKLDKNKATDQSAYVPKAFMARLKLLLHLGLERSGCRLQHQESIAPRSLLQE